MPPTSYQAVDLREFQEWQICTLLQNIISWTDFKYENYNILSSVNSENMNSSYQYAGIVHTYTVYRLDTFKITVLLMRQCAIWYVSIKV
jgi:hypothetical protein